MFKFFCEWKSEIPLPPKYTFPQAFNYLNPESNSFYILESEGRGYVQCGGSKVRCTIELRETNENGEFKHFVLALGDEDRSKVQIEMSSGGVEVLADQVLNYNNAIEVFKSYFEELKIPDRYRLYDITENFQNN